MSDGSTVKATFRDHLQVTREALLWKVDGLGERELRLPRTPTGTNLLGIVRHCANVELGYLGVTFGRPWPHPAAPGFVTEADQADDPQADWWVDAETPAEVVTDFYREVWTFADATIEALPLDVWVVHARRARRLAGRSSTADPPPEGEPPGA